MLAVEVAGLDFPNPVGLAAGFDKDAEVFRQMLGFGFGFVEVGTLTPRPQAGNPKPRLFRLVEDRAVINRMGFNNRGPAGGAGAARADGADRAPGGIVGVNIGANKDSADRIADYAAGVARDARRRRLSHRQHLLAQHAGPARAAGQGRAGRAARRGDGGARRRAACLPQGRAGPRARRMSTTSPRVAIDAADRRADRRQHHDQPAAACVSRHRDEAGGLSGAPLKALALERLRDFRRATGGALPLIAVGGIENGVDAFDRIRAGASLVQLYTALVYEGPGPGQADQWRAQAPADAARLFEHRRGDRDGSRLDWPL